MPVRIAVQKQSDQGLHCLSMPFWKEISVQNFRTFTVFYIKSSKTKLTKIYIEKFNGTSCTLKKR